MLTLILTLILTLSYPYPYSTPKPESEPNSNPNFNPNPTPKPNPDHKPNSYSVGLANLFFIQTREWQNYNRGLKNLWTTSCIKMIGIGI